MKRRDLGGCCRGFAAKALFHAPEYRLPKGHGTQSFDKIASGGRRSNEESYVNDKP